MENSCWSGWFRRGGSAEVEVARSSTSGGRASCWRTASAVCKWARKSLGRDPTALSLPESAMIPPWKGSSLRGYLLRALLVLASLLPCAGGPRHPSCSIAWKKEATVPYALSGAACSNDGSDIILATPGDSLYFSFTFGSGFAQVSSLADWQGVAISSNGKFAAAVANGDSNVYVLSTNPQHQTPIPVRAPGPPGFTTVAIPAGTNNGFPLFVAQGKHSGLIYEVDSSSSVTARPGQSQQHWVGIAVSADGQKGYAAGGGPDLEYIFRFEGGGPWVQAFGPNNWTGGVPLCIALFLYDFL